MTQSNEAIYAQFHIGETVQIIELKTEKYNECFAQVVGPYLIDTERWPVQLINESKDKLAIKPVNLKRVMPIAYKPSYSTGVYGGYNYTIDDINIEKEVKEEKKEQVTVTRDRFPVEVFVRMRPLVGLEIVEKHESLRYNVKKLKKKQTTSVILKNVHGRNNERDKKYAGFKGIVLPKWDNVKTFNHCISLSCVPYIFDGGNMCTFAYGHTGSGKTHTIFGYKKELGMCQLFGRRIFNDVRVQSSDDIFVEIRFCELYQGKIYDLLSGAAKREYFVRESQKGIVHLRAEPIKCADGKIRAYPMNNVHVKTEEELVKVISDGIGSRNVGNSSLHDKSSRSHAFLELELVSTELIKLRKTLVEIEADILQTQMILDAMATGASNQSKRHDLVRDLQKGRTSGQMLKVLEKCRKEEKKIKIKMKKILNDKKRPFIGGTMVFVDLAGNEYGRDVKNKDAQEERERNENNKSLLALKEVIRSLHKKKDHIRYRDSKLTMYLKKYLSGKESKAIMLSCIGSSQNYTKQTINTMQYTQLVAKA